MRRERVSRGVQAVAAGERLVQERRRLAKEGEEKREEGEEHAGAVEQEGSLSPDVDSSQAALRQAGRQPAAFGRGKQARVRPLFFHFLLGGRIGNEEDGEVFFSKGRSSSSTGSDPSHTAIRPLTSLKVFFLRV